MTTALVLGSTGRLGRILRRVWQQQSGSISAFHWISRGAQPGCISWTPGEPTGALPRADVVIALWGVVSGTPAELAKNAELARQAMDLTAEIGAKRVLLMSSAAVYGPSDAPLPETADRTPVTDYGIAKCAMEDVVQDWCAANPNGPETCVLRVGNVAGADRLFAALDDGGPVVLDQFEDGNGPKRSYVAPTDLGRALVDLATCPDRYLPRFINIAGPRPVAMDLIVRAAERMIKWTPAPDDAVPALTLDTGRISRLSGELVASSDAGCLVADWRDFGETAQRDRAE